MDENGYLLIEAGTTKTAVDGVFAAEIFQIMSTDKLLLQERDMAALDAERFLAEQK